MRKCLRPSFLKAAVAAMVAAVAAPLLGSIVPSFFLEDLLDRSENIVEGTIVRSWSGWDARHATIWTHCQVQVSEWIRGFGGASIVVSEPGGSADGIHQQISGAVHYQTGEHVLLFLYKTPIGFIRATGAGQGKFTISPDGLVNLDIGDVSVAEAARAPGTSLTTFDRQRIETMKSRVRRLALLRPYKGTSK